MGSSVSECACNLFEPPFKPSPNINGYISSDSDSDIDDSQHFENINKTNKTNKTKNKNKKNNFSDSSIDSDSEGNELIKMFTNYSKSSKLNKITTTTQQKHDDDNKQYGMGTDNDLETNKKQEYIEYMKQNMISGQKQTFNHKKPKQTSPNKNKQIQFNILSDDSDDDEYDINNIDEYDNNDDNDDNLSQCSTQATRPMHVTSFDDDFLIPSQDNMNNGLPEIIDFVDDTQSVIIHPNDNNSDSNSISLHSHNSHQSTNSYHYHSNRRSLIQSKSIPVPILAETNTVSFEGMLPMNGQIQPQYHMDVNNDNNHFRSHSVGPPVPINTFSIIQSPPLPPQSTPLLIERRHSMMPQTIHYHQKYENTNNDKRLSTSSDLSISHVSYSQYPSFPTPTSTHNQSLSVYTLSQSRSQSQPMTKTHHAPSRSMDGIWSDNMQIIDKPINKIKSRKGKQTRVFTPRNLKNWSNEQINSEQEAMQKQILFLKQFENSRKSIQSNQTNWISPTDNDEFLH